MIRIEGGEIKLGKVEVITSQEGGHSTDVWVDLLMRRLVNVAETAPPVIRDQAEAFKLDITKTVSYYMREAVRAERDRIVYKLEMEGLPEVAAAVRDMERK